MIVRREKQFQIGYNSIIEMNGKHPEMLLDFGILKLEAGQSWECSLDLERAWLLIDGEVEFFWDGNSKTGKRTSCFDENPTVLHVPAKMPVKIIAIEDSELCVERCKNSILWEPTFYAPENIRCDVFGAGVLHEASIRTVRTVFD